MSDSELDSDESNRVIFSNSEDLDSDNEGPGSTTTNFDENRISNASPVQSEKYASSDESNRDFGKNGKKSFKPKVKIKTLTIDGQLVYFCKICDKIFTRRKDKLNHELAHSGESVLTCNECGKEYLHESSLASHMRTHDGDPLYMCDLCPKMFAQSHHLKSHILSHSEPTSFVCKTCYVEFATVADLNHHCRVQIKLEMTKYLCKMCKIYMCRSHVGQNETRLHAYICSACNEFFYTNKKLKIHMKKFAHFSIEKSKCIEPLQEYELYPLKVSENLRKFTTQKELEAMKKMGKDNLFCNQNVSESPEYELPAKRFKLSARKVLQEDENNSSTSVQDSVSEIKVEPNLKSPNKHRKGKPYCKKCNRSFKDGAELERHKVQAHERETQPLSSSPCHSVEKEKTDDLSCPMCGEHFACSLHLTKHLKSHVDELTHKCNQCGKGFKHKVQLLQHVRLHLSQDANMNETKLTDKQESPVLSSQFKGDEGSFKCQLCSKLFHFHHKLLSHMRLHNNVKCFQCYICHEQFATKHYLLSHLQAHARQGVDTSNTVLEEESKAGLDDARFPKSFCNAAGCGLEGCIHVNRESAHNPDFTTLQENDSDIEGWMPKSNLLHLSSGAIKLEPQNESDSENSSCSYMTRDSERSDPFRFSSDESNSFKTTMAKERRRLKRRWLRLARQIQPMKKVKEEDDRCPPELNNENSEEDITDMMVELNGVQSEIDNVMTIYVDLAHMKKLPKKIDEALPGLCPDSKLELPDNPTLVFENAVKIEAHEDREPMMLGVTYSTADTCKETQAEVSLKNSEVPKTFLSPPPLVTNSVSQSEISKVSPQYLQHPHYLNPLSSSSSVISGSNLEKLQVAFQGSSSKYLPSLQEVALPASSCKPKPTGNDSFYANKKLAVDSAADSHNKGACPANVAVSESDSSFSDPYHIDLDRPLVIDIPSEEPSPRANSTSLVRSSKVSDISTPSIITSHQGYSYRQDIQDFRQIHLSQPIKSIGTRGAVSGHVQSHPHDTPSLRLNKSQAKGFDLSQNSVVTSSASAHVRSEISTGPSTAMVAPSSIAAGSTSLAGNHATNNPSLIGQNPGTFCLNVSSIFDTNNHSLRDMNMMDLVSPNNQGMSTAPTLPSTMPGSAFSVIQQNSVRSMETPSLSMHPQNFSIHSGNPGPGMGVMGNHFSLGPQQLTGPTNFGINGPQINGLVTGHGLSLPIQNLNDATSVHRDNAINAVNVFPSMPLHMNGLFPINSIPHLSYNPAQQFAGLGGPLPSNAFDASGFFNLNNPMVSMPNGLPLSLPANPVFVNSFGNATIGCGAFSGFQEPMVNAGPPFGVSLLNQPMMVPGVNSLLPGHSFSVLSNFNPGFFSQFP